MAKQNIFVGSVPNDRTGTNMREAGTIINQNFGEIYTALGDGTNISVDGFVSNTDFQATLANTNSSIAATNSSIATTAATERAALANTNAYIATVQSSIAASAALGNTNLRIDLVNTNLTTTNTAIRTLVNDRVQVANADVKYAQLASNNDFLSTSQMRVGAPVKTTTSNAYSLLINDAGFYHRLNFSGVTAVGVTIPANSAEAIPIGSEYMFIRTGSNTSIVFVPAGGVTLNSDGGKTRVQYQWQTVVCKKVATDEWDLIGNLSI